ncbi:MAG: hypothetical protein AAF393_17170 [Pseudomonadota bacterium]
MSDSKKNVLKGLILIMSQTIHMKRKKVITLDVSKLRYEMHRLWCMVIDAGEAPDLLVGIATGGELCAREICSNVPAGMKVVALRRPTTELKQHSTFRRLLWRLPYAISNRLRLIEDRLLELQAGQADRPIIAPVTEELRAGVAEVAATVKERASRCVLVIDDAIDSGATMGRVVTELRAALPHDTRILTAVLTQTRATSIFTPDFRLHYGVLLRFPWSLDFRGV